MVHLAVMVKTQTSTTNPDSPTSCNNNPAYRHLRGFTLIELLVVLAIAGLLMSLAPVAYNKSRESTQYSTTLRTITADMRRARQNAIAHGRSTIFFIDLVQRRYGVEGLGARNLPESLQIKATVGSKQLKEASVASIEFLPDGGATGGSIDVLRPNGAGTRLRVDWLSGQITQERLPQ